MPRRAVLLLLLIGGTTLDAQTFEAASIKPSAPTAVGSTYDYQTGGGLRVRNGTLGGLIESAYDVRDFQIAGGPGWLDTDRFDVIARSESGRPAPSRDEDTKTTRTKLQALLADRFHLIVHRETREHAEYALTVGRDGPRLAVVPPGTAPRPPTGIQSASGHLVGRQATMAQLVFALSRRLGQPVVDSTGLRERYDFEMTWAELDAAADRASDAPSIFTAIQEQLGLKLESIKGPVDTIVVDRAEPPTPD